MSEYGKQKTCIPRRQLSALHLSFAAGKAEALTTPRSNAILYKLSILVIGRWFQEEAEGKQFTGNTNHWTRDKD